MGSPRAHASDVPRSWARVARLAAARRQVAGAERALRPSVALAGTEYELDETMLNPTTARELIKPHMPVVSSNDRRFATVDHLESGDTIKLTRDTNGQHHYIPLGWVTKVDDEVHIDRPGEQAMAEWSTTPPAGGQDAAGSTEQMRGQPLAARVAARKAELEQALSDLGPEATGTRGEIEQALAALASLSTGDLTHPSDVVASQLSDWLERNKHMGAKATTSQPLEPAPADRMP
jgi:hypothetical protein